MADAARIIDRIRARGANIMINGDKLVIVNKTKLSPEALAYIRDHGREIADFLTVEAEVEERAAIIEFDGKAPREWAEQFADVLIRYRPQGVSDLDWSWFVTRCGQMIDEEPERMAA